MEEKAGMDLMHVLCSTYKMPCFYMTACCGPIFKFPLLCDLLLAYLLQPHGVNMVNILWQSHISLNCTRAL